MLRRMLLVVTLVIGSVALPAGPAAASSMSCPTFQGVLYPGGEISRRCEITNLQGVDATFYTFIPQDTLRVLDNEDNDVTGTPDGNLFLSYFSWSQESQIVTTIMNPLPTRQGEQDDIDLLQTERFRKTCDRRPLTSLSGDTENLEATHCRIGRVRRADYLPPTFNSRQFIETLHMADEGNQSKFAGWGITFSETFRARVPAASECPADGCLPIYER